jgi:hypothetical protein
MREIAGIETIRVHTVVSAALAEILASSTAKPGV